MSAAPVPTSASLPLPGSSPPGASPPSGSGRGSAAGARRAELASFLRERRARITPDSVGLPPGPRRRTPGLRREELAQLAGVGVTWYTWLEQGRPINASGQVLTSIARTLRLDQTEQAYLYRLADVPPPRQQFDSTLEPEIQTVLDELHRIPAAVFSPRHDLLRKNAAYTALFPSCALAARANLLWSAFTVADCCTPYVDRDAELPAMVALFRHSYGRHVGEPAWESFVAELVEASDEFARLWARQEVAAPRARLKHFRHPVSGAVRVIATYLTIPSTPEAWISVYTPADDASRASIDWLIDHPQEGRPNHTH